MYTLAELARRVGGEVVGEPSRAIAGVRTLAGAGPEHLAFLTSGKYAEAAARSRAGAILAVSALAAPACDWLVASDPQTALAEILDLFHPETRPAPGIHATAVVDSAAAIDPRAAIGPYAVVGAGARIAGGVVVEAHAVVGRGVTIGEGSWIKPHVVLYDGVEIGRRVVIHAGTVVGSDGFGYASGPAGHRKIAQVGTVVVEDDVEIGALTAIDRAALDRTRIGAGTKIDNLVQVGHNVDIGRGVILCGQAGIAGSAKLGDGVVLAGQAGVAGHLEIGAGAQVAAKSAALGSVPAGTKVAGIPAIELSAWRRQQAVARRMGELLRRVRALERRIAGDELEGNDGDDG